MNLAHHRLSRAFPLLAFIWATAGASAATADDQAGSTFSAQHNHAAHAHHGGGYTSLRARDIKALSPEQVEDLTQGRGMGMSLPAELHHVPGPLHLLQMRETIGLNARQSQQLQRIVDTMKTEAIALGKSIVEAERQLDGSFERGVASAESIETQTREIALLMGRLRATHLKAHLEAAALLTPGQIADYDRARGYGDAPPATP